MAFGIGKVKKVTINTEPRWTASAYVAGVLTKEDINDLIDGKTITVDKKELPNRQLMELVYIGEDGETPIPVDVATDEDKKDLDEAVWYSTQAKVVEDKKTSKAFLECYRALEAGEPIGKKGTAEAETKTTEEETPKPKQKKPTQQKPEGQKKPEQGTKSAQKQQSKSGAKPSGQKPGEKPAPAKSNILLEISNEDFKSMDRKAQIKLVSELQERANAYSKRVDELAKLIKKDAKRGAKADANSEQLYDLLRNNVKKSDRALVDQLQEAGENPIKVAEAYFGLTLTEFKKKGKKDNKKSKKSTAVPDKIGSGVTMLGAKLLILLKQAQMTAEDIDLLEIDPRKQVDLGEVEAFIGELGYGVDSDVIQALQSVQ